MRFKKGRDTTLKKMHEAKRTAMSLAGLVAVLCCVLIPFRVLSQDNSSNTIIVGVPADRCPIFYIDRKSNEITGIGVDLMSYAADKSGLKAEFKVIKEKTLKDALDNPEYDLLMPFGSAVDSSSGKNSIVSDNLMQTPFTMVTKGSSILPSLNASRIGMLSSLAAGAETIKELYPGMEISFYEDMNECVKALRAGEVDALLHNSYVWSYILQKPAYSDLTVQPAAMFSMDFRAGTINDQKGQELIARINKGINDIDDAKRQAIILDHTSRKLYQYDLSDYLYQYGMFMLAGALIAALLVIFAIQRIRLVRKWHEQKMQQMMDHDSLTGLLSMNGFRKRAEEILRKHPDTPYFLSYNNIRDFKFINDSLGREAGDELLKFWAAKSMENLSDEYEAIGRIEGDHFVVLRLIKNDENMTDDVEKVFTPVENYFINQGKDHRVKIISGIYVLTPKDFRKIDVDHMLDLARVAERRARDNRKSDHEFYNPEQWQKGKRIAEIINYLPSAIEAGDIQVWYQPQIDYSSMKINGAEALCRWDHTKLGWLYPFDFISTLEEAGLIYDLDSFVWERVCQDLDRWNKEGKRRSVSVNVSRDDIQEGNDISAHFLDLIRKYNIEPDQLHIEITETAYVENPAYLIETTEKLRANGFQVEMDDFGSGYSSLHMLKDVPIDRIKLDLHFLTESGDPQKSRTIVSSMIQMINQLNMEMIAEGVETAEQADFLLSKGCSEMQGYYFYKPMPVKDFEALFENKE